MVRARARSRGLGAQHVEVVAEELDADVGAHAGDHLVDAHLDRLREDRPHARQVLAARRCMARTSSSWVSARRQRARGVSVTNTSESSTPIGSVATSAVPVRVQMRSISSETRQQRARCACRSAPTRRARRRRGARC
jgi:hypothetical protein